jgi:hypothetical protein
VRRGEAIHSDHPPCIEDDRIWRAGIPGGLYAARSQQPHGPHCSTPLLCFQGISLAHRALNRDLTTVSGYCRFSRKPLIIPHLRSIVSSNSDGKTCFTSNPDNILGKRYHDVSRRPTRPPEDLRKTHQKSIPEDIQSLSNTTSPGFQYLLIDHPRGSQKGSPRCRSKKLC